MPPLKDRVQRAVREDVTNRQAFREHWDRLLFRDYLVARPADARAYEALKRRLAAAHPYDRVTYTNGKSSFIRRITAKAMAGR
jgi:GrpB-like predicted nucleotidyltransferase (UPF0157 family)